MGLLSSKLPKGRHDLLAALDVGASKVCCAIARLNDSSSSVKDKSSLRLIGVGQQLSRGIKGNVIIDLEALEDSILNAVHSAEQMAGETIHRLYVNLPAGCVRSYTVTPMIALRDQPVGEAHMRRLLTLPEGQYPSEEWQVVHAVPLTYTLDQTSGIRDPRGMVGERLGVVLHMVAAPANIIKNLTLCIGRCHLDVSGFVVTPYASGLATLVDDEVELGATVVDMGGGTTTLASFLEGTLVRIDSIPIGAHHVTQDIARVLSTPLAHAERLKTLYGGLMTSSFEERENIFVPQLGETSTRHAHQISKSFLTHVIRARVEEILEMIWQKLKTTEMDRLVCQRIVLTGGGSQLPGIRDLAATLWKKQVRIGQPLNFSRMNDVSTDPMFATAAGLLQYGLKDYLGGQETIKLSIGPVRYWQKAVLWVRENF